MIIDKRNLGIDTIYTVDSCRSFDVRRPNRKGCPPGQYILFAAKYLEKLWSKPDGSMPAFVRGTLFNCLSIE